MNCKKCGASYENGTAFCPNCGAPVDDVTPSAETNPTATDAIAAANTNASTNKKQLLIAGVCILAALIILIVLFSTLFGNSAKSVTKKYYKALEKSSASKLLDTVPDDYLKEIRKENDLSKKELKEKVQEYLDENDDYDDISVTFKGSEKMSSKEISEELSDDFAGSKVKKAIEYDLKVKYTTDKGDNVSTEEEEFIVFKYKGDWYSLDAMFIVTWAAYF